MDLEIIRAILNRISSAIDDDETLAQFSLNHDGGWNVWIGRPGRSPITLAHGTTDQELRELATQRNFTEIIPKR